MRCQPEASALAFGALPERDEGHGGTETLFEPAPPACTDQDDTLRQRFPAFPPITAEFPGALLAFGLCAPSERAKRTGDCRPPRATTSRRTARPKIEVFVQPGGQLNGRPASRCR